MLNERNTPLEDDGIEEEILVEEECSVAQAVWGDILGNIENQTDLQNALDAKQDSLTEAQLSAVNSGITAGKVETYDGYADQIASKADQSALNAESTARGKADTALGTRIDNEALARQRADNGLQSQIDAITSKSDVVDVVANYAALQAYDTSTLGNNDVVKVLDDETHEDALTYYRWSTTTQTWSYIGQEAPYYSKGQMDVKLAEKQDKLTAGANIQIQNGTISATDTTYTAGNGLNLNGTEFSADTDVLATKEDLEGYYTKPETDNLLAPKLEAEVVAELPTTGEEGKLYLTPKAHTTSTATGNPITATITDGAGKIESFKLDGDTFQQTYTGKNLIHFVAPSVNTRGLTVTADIYSGAITFGGTTDAGYPWVIQATGLSLPAGTYTFSIDHALPYTLSLRLYETSSSYPKTAAIQAGQTSATVTTTYTITQVVGLYGASTSGIVVSNTTIYPQFELNSSATSFEPFVGGQPSPSPDYPQPIQTVTGEQTVEIVGKNLFDKDNANIVRGYIAGTLFNAGTDYSVFMPCEENTTYTIQKMVAQPQTANRFRINSYNKIPVGGDSSINNLYFWNAGDGTDVTTHTYTTPAGAKYLGITVMTQNASGTTTIDEMLASIQVELGSTASAYTPYTSTSYPLNLGSIELCKLDTYQDYIWKDGEDWKVHKAIAKATLDGSENWTKNDNANPFYVANIYNKIGACKQATSPASALFSHFTTVGIYGSDTNLGACVLVDAPLNITNIRARLSDMSGSLSSFKTILSEKRPVLYVRKDVPADTTITDTTLIAQLEAIRTASLQNGTNTITNSATGTNLAGDMEIGYYGFNPTNRYDKFIWLDLNNNYEQIGS